MANEPEADNEIDLHSDGNALKYPFSKIVHLQETQKSYFKYSYFFLI